MLELQITFSGVEIGNFELAQNLLQEDTWMNELIISASTKKQPLIRYKTLSLKAIVRYRGIV